MMAKVELRKGCNVRNQNKKTINSIGGMSEQAKERLFNKVVVWKQSY